MHDEALYVNEHYLVMPYPDAMGEDNRYGRQGYACVNIETAQVEHTCMALPQAIYQADYMSGALGGLNKAHETVEELVSDEDIILN